LYRYLTEIQDAAQRSADLTRQLLAFARKQTVNPKVLDLNETVASMLKMLQRLIGEDVELVWKPGDPLGQVKIDPSQFDQVLANLAVNARDAISGVGKITIETDSQLIDETFCACHAGFTPGEFVKLSVSDDGCGMDSETLGKIFEPFFTTKVMGEGTGLGLATVYGIVKQNEGSISVYSEPGHGTTFHIYLPRLRSEESIVNKAGVGVITPTTGTETILIVEDEEAILSIGQAILGRLGYNVLTASTAAEAIRCANVYSGVIHLLLTDVVMPEMNGRELAERISLLRPGIRTLYMSGYTAHVIAHRGVLNEGVMFLQKPFSGASLASKIREVLEA
jgi:CheY-like chemotaxis protein